MWHKIKSALAWVGGALVAATSLFLGFLFFRKRRLAQAEALHRSADRAQAEHDDKMHSSITAAAAQALVHANQAVEQHQNDLQEIKASAHAQATALQNDLSSLAAALDRKAKRD